MNQYTLKIYPAGKGREAYRVIEICGKDTLDRLCSVILDAFNFTDDHLYEFCMDNRMYSGFSYRSDPSVGGPSTNIKLDRLGLHERQKFSLHYDFGDDWMFTINVTKIMEVGSYHGAAVIKEKGNVEQYPDYDEDWDEDDD